MLSCWMLQPHYLFHHSCIQDNHCKEENKNCCPVGYQACFLGSGPEGADDLCCFYLGLKDGIRAWRLQLGP